MHHRLGYLLALILTLICALTAWRPAAAQPGIPMDQPATDGGGMIQYWLAAAPFPVNTMNFAKALDVDYLHMGAIPRPLPGDKVVTTGGQTVVWQGLTAGSGGIADLAVAYGQLEYSMAYLVSYVVSDRDIPGVVLYWTCDDEGVVYVNGEEVGRYTMGRPVMPDSDVTADFTLKKGVNVIMIKVENWSEQWGACARLVDADNHPLAGLPIVAAPPEKVAPDNFGWVMANDSGFGPPAPPAPQSTQFTLPAPRFRPTAQKAVTFTSDIPVHLRCVEIREAATGKVVYKIPTDGGSIGIPVNDDSETVRMITFTDFTTPGMYYLYNPDFKVTSPAFVIL